MLFESKWGKFLKESIQDSNVICHITGYSGSGKSTLLKIIKKKFPNVSILDLDDLDKKADKILKHPKDWKSNSYSDEKLLKSHDIRQKLLNNFIKKNKNIVLAGHHIELPTVYDFNSIQNFILDISKDVISKQKTKRDKQSPEEFETQYSEESEIFDDLPNYLKATPQQILQFISEHVR